MESLLTLIITVAVAAALIQISRNKTKRLRELKLAYERSLKGTNKRTALAAGRAYYSALRKTQTLTIYDEQAITNDLSTMNDHPVINLQ